MASSPDIAAAAVLFADASRARMLTALADGRALPASVLAAESGVAASTASGHLARLVAAGVLTVERSGRHRYYRLGSAEVAAALEALAALAPPPELRSLRDATRSAGLRRARTCYDHLAGRLGVAVTAALVERDALRRSGGGCPFALGPQARPVLAGLGVDLAALQQRPRSARPLLRACVDWSERRHHLAGALGAAVLDAALVAGWVERQPGRRSLTVTAAGDAALRELLGGASYAAYAVAS